MGRLALGALLLLLGACARAFAQEPEPEPQKKVADVSVGYVLVPFVVTDLKGVPVKTLRREDVTLLVDGEPVALDLFERSDDAPVSYTILLDGSGSMGLLGKLDGARAGISALLSAKKPGDDFSLHVFSAGKMTEVVPFTEDADAVRQAVAKLKPFGRTAFYDALAKMPDKSLQGRNGARAIILMTDGLDNASTLTREGLAEMLEGIDVPVYPIGLRSPGAPTTASPGVNPEALLNLEILGHVARISGGRFSVVDDKALLPGALRGIESDLRSQYLVGFTPSGKGPVRYRRITLKISGSLRYLRVRAGYTGTAPARDEAGEPTGKKRKGSRR